MLTLCCHYFSQVVNNFLAVVGLIILDDVIVFVEGFVGVFVIIPWKDFLAGVLVDEVEDGLVVVIDV